MTTTIARPNRDALDKAIGVYRDAVRPFIVRTLKANVKGATVEEAIRHALKDRSRGQFDASLKANGGNAAAAIDVNDFPQIVQRNSGAFSAYGNLLNGMFLVVEARNPAAHPPDRDMDAEFARATLTYIAGVLGRSNHPAQKAEVEAIRDALVAPPPPAPEPAPAPANGKPAPKRGASHDLKPWRDAIRPRHDVLSGQLDLQKFAADLHLVHVGDATGDYANPVTFFAQTYITPGLRSLLLNAAKRLGGKGGDPVIQTKTGFGGGKTHSLIALYHLAKSGGALVNPADPKDGERVNKEVRSILADAGLDPDEPPDAKVAVLDGTQLNPATGTLWGEMARQLGGDEAYAFVKPAIDAGVAPTGDQLDPLLEQVGPCVILVDELVAYARNAPSGERERGEMLARLFTFVQALTQSVRRSPNAVLVVTLLQSEAQVGGQVGVDVLHELEGILGRIEAVWEPLQISEAFEVVRRRLFGDDLDEAERKRTCQAFAAMYGRARREFPLQMSEARYADRLRQCYPIHPEIFDRLYEDWSATPQFQRTRGVLRLMAIAVSRLYRDNDAAPLIMPANLPLQGQADNSLAAEFKRFLEGNWAPVLTEVDDDGSRADDIDKKSNRFAEVGGAARRLARAIFLGSAPVGAAKGIDEARVHAAVMQPGHGVADYNDALRLMVDDLHFLYHQDGRYYFHVEENLNKAAADRARVIEQRALDDYVTRDLLPGSVAARRRDVIIAPQDSAEIPEADEVRLIVLPPDKHLPSRSSEEKKALAERWAQEALLNRGDAGRVARNTLLFLAAKADEIRALRDAVAKRLSWFSIVNGGEHGHKIEMTGERAAQAHASLRAADVEMNAALVNAYRWSLAPTQPDPQKADYLFHAIHIPRSAGGDVVQAAFDACVHEEQLADRIAPSQLANVLDQWVWSKEPTAERVSVDALWDMLAANVYMPRLRGKTALQQCVLDGAEQSAFGYADAYSDGEYENLRFGRRPQAHGAAESASAILVHPGAARDRAPQPQSPGDADPAGSAPGATATTGGVIPWPSEPPQTAAGPARLTIRKRVAGEISLDDLGLLRDEIIANLLRDGAEVTIEITGSKPAGFSDGARRAVRENSAQLSLEFNETTEG